MGVSLGKVIKSITSPLANNLFKSPSRPNPYDSSNDIGALNQLAAEEEAKRKALGLQQQGQINQFADQMAGDAANYRKILANNLANTSQQTFNQALPGLLEDLNSRGLFTSQTARDQETNRALQELSTQQNKVLSDYDTTQFGNIQDIRGSALSALLGGDQSALDSALALRKAGVQRSFDVADQNAQNDMSTYLAKKQSRDQLISSLIGAGGSLGAGMMCFDGSTNIEMMDGSKCEISEVKLGDTTKGGIVISIRQAITPAGTRFNYNGTVVTGSHAVFENGMWKRVGDSEKSVPVEGGGIIYALVTTGHRIYANGETFGDEIEIDDYKFYQEKINEETLRQLNNNLIGSVA